MELTPLAIKLLYFFTGLNLGIILGGLIVYLTSFSSMHKAFDQGALADMRKKFDKAAEKYKIDV